MGLRRKKGRGQAAPLPPDAGAKEAANSSFCEAAPRVKHLCSVVTSCFGNTLPKASAGAGCAVREPRAAEARGAGA